MHGPLLEVESADHHWLAWPRFFAAHRVRRSPGAAQGQLHSFHIRSFREVAGRQAVTTVVTVRGRRSPPVAEPGPRALESREKSRHGA